MSHKNVNAEYGKYVILCPNCDKGVIWYQGKHDCWEGDDCPRCLGKGIVDEKPIRSVDDSSNNIDDSSNLL